jgi:hypothetical protein
MGPVMYADTITRKEIAALLNVDINKLAQMISCHKRLKNFPKPLGKKSYHFYYQTSDALISLHKSGYISKELLDSLLVKKESVGFLDFIQGKFDRKELVNQYRYKRIASKVTKPKSVRVVIEGEFAF